MGAGDEFHGEAEAAFLTAGEDFDGTIREGCETSFFEDAIDAVVEFGVVFCFDAEAGGGFD